MTKSQSSQAKPTRPRHVYAVIRLDLFQKDCRSAVTVKAVRDSEKEAFAEVERLNNLRTKEGTSSEIIYFAQVTRYFGPESPGSLIANRSDGDDE